ncbi:MAG: segregation/condensation protein A, partial [Lachnospiraceae bacterium]|nr:segregation/condensation protein A [Lachnospiraceae bacterium]
QEDKIDPIRSQFGKIEKDEINIEDKQNYIEEYMKNNKYFSFRELLEKQGNKLEMIVTFLTILEMMKQGVITIEQEDIFGDIMITSSLAA